MLFCLEYYKNNKTNKTTSFDRSHRRVTLSYSFNTYIFIIYYFYFFINIKNVVN